MLDNYPNTWLAFGAQANLLTLFDVEGERGKAAEPPRGSLALALRSEPQP